MSAAKRVKLSAVKPIICPNCSSRTLKLVSMTLARYRADQRALKAAKRWFDSGQGFYECGLLNKALSNYNRATQPSKKGR